VAGRHRQRGRLGALCTVWTGLFGQEQGVGVGPPPPQAPGSRVCGRARVVAGGKWARPGGKPGCMGGPVTGAGNFLYIEIAI